MYKQRNCTTGFVYLLRFDRPISEAHTTQHYIGWTNDLATRMQAHHLGHGSRLCQVANERGIRFQIARVWRGDRALERKLKRWKCAPKLARRECSPAGVVELSRPEIEEALIAF
ncbi:MAG: hypothetical protein KC441_17495 [Anaerolineales bacterium]|nr:hypothetical protein [Anaerolineales bacterium]